MCAVVRMMPLVLVLAGCAAAGRPGGHDPGERTYAPPRGEHAHHSFQDADKWAALFESEERDEWQEPETVLRFLDLAPDARVADIGSATGYFPVRFARAVPDGTIYGIDIEPDMVRYLNERADREGLPNLVSILGAPDDPKLPGSVDLIFLCNTYHHIEDRVVYFQRLSRKLQPGGEVVIVDFLPGELPVGPPPEMKLSREAVVAELQKAGYRLDREEMLPYQYMLALVVDHDATYDVTPDTLHKKLDK